ncbi:putative poly-A RNA export protein DBP5 [Blattamonas nauphoetae]|uniref:ATP-dependent RNA helicase n=1 Tax=Blattamonas nauphoetae TaxID=2049346 RepID=A0ABQ9XM67_9EUKA|nr:putative poly-A RNA export protein DBP5 [Blattamonas nauphoetae]
MMLKPTAQAFVPKGTVPLTPVKTNSPVQVQPTTFESLGIPPQIIRAIYDMKYETPSEIQAKALPIILKEPRRHFVGQAQSGTGKTATFLIAALCSIDTRIQSPQAIIVAPSRELANQIYNVGLKLAKYSGITIKRLIPQPDDSDDQFGVGITEQIIVSTPTSLNDYIQHGEVMTEDLKIAIFDEADEQFVQTKPNYSHSLPILRSLGPTTQIVFFSATLTAISDDFYTRFLPNCKKISLSTAQLSLDEIVQFYVVFLSTDEKLQFLGEIFSRLPIGQLVIFVESNQTAHLVQSHLIAQGNSVGIIVGGGEMSGAERDTVLSQFRSAKLRILVSTNVISRGIDVDAVNLVINFAPPTDPNTHLPDPETYLHRIGRTGRYKKKGVALTFITPDEYKLMSFFSWHFKKDVLELTDFDELNPFFFGDDKVDPSQATKKSKLDANAAEFISRKKVTKIQNKRGQMETYVSFGQGGGRFVLGDDEEDEYDEEFPMDEFEQFLDEMTVKQDPSMADFDHY